MIAGLLAVVPVTAAAQDTTVAREKVHGVASGFAGNCPDELPAVPMVCTEWVIEPFDAPFVVGGGSVASQGWQLNLLCHTLTFSGGDDEPVESDVAFAQVPVTDVTFDQPHLD